MEGNLVKAGAEVKPVAKMVRTDMGKDGIGHNGKKGMRIYRYLMVVTLLMAMFTTSCNRKIVPGLKGGKSGKEYDQTTFSWYFVEATRQKLLGNMGEALKNLEQCILINPGSDAAFYQIAQIMINNGNLQNGKKYLWKAAELEPANLWYQMTLSGIYFQEKNLDSAIICYEKAVKAFPEKENLQLTLADLYTENKNFGRALDILGKFDEKYGVNESTTLSLVQTLMAEKRYVEAKNKIEVLLSQKPDEVVYNGLLAEIYRGQGDNQEALAVYNKLIMSNPGDPRVQLSLYDFLMSEKNYEEVLELMKTVIFNEKISKEEKVTLVAELIEKDEIIGKYGPGLEQVIRELEDNYKNDNIVSLIKPEYLQKVGRLKEAATILEGLIERNPENYLSWERLLLVYYDLKDYIKLEERGRECATKFNRSVLAKILYASAAMENKHFDTALEELRKADILAGDNKEIKLQVMTMKADIYYRMKNFEDSFKTFDEALKLNEEDLTVMNNYAYYLAEENMRLKEAEKMAEEVIQKEGNNNTFLDTYAWVLYKRGKNRQAAKIMNQIINSGEKDDAEWYEHYGYILKTMGKCDDAIAKWEKAIMIDGSKTTLKTEIENCKR